MADHNNHRWQEVASSIEAMVSDHPRKALYVESHATGGGSGWPGLAAITSDIGDTDPYFGTRSINLIVLSAPSKPEEGAGYDAQVARLMAQYAKFSAYKTIVYIDSPTIIGVDPHADLAGFISSVTSLCDSLAGHGWEYGGAVDYASEDASTFIAEIDGFFGFDQ